jgi:hypothetical protein
VREPPFSDSFVFQILRLVGPNPSCRDGCNHGLVREERDNWAHETRVVVVAQSLASTRVFDRVSFHPLSLNLAGPQYSNNGTLPPTMGFEELDGRSVFTGAPTRQ